MVFQKSLNQISFLLCFQKAERPVAFRKWKKVAFFEHVCAGNFSTEYSQTFCEAGIFPFYRWGWGTWGYVVSKCQNQSVHGVHPVPKSRHGALGHAPPLALPPVPSLPTHITPLRVASWLVAGISVSSKTLLKCYFFYEASMDYLILLIDLYNITHPPSYPRQVVPLPRGGYTFPDPQWMSETIDSTESYLFYVFLYIVPTRKLNL